VDLEFRPAGAGRRGFAQQPPFALEFHHAPMHALKRNPGFARYVRLAQRDRLSPLHSNRQLAAKAHRVQA
jgi:hypothetical protein